MSLNYTRVTFHIRFHNNGVSLSIFVLYSVIAYYASWSNVQINKF